MTIEEIEQTLQTVAENQARTSADIGALREQTEKLVGASQVLEEAAALHQQVLRNHEARQAKLEESFQTLVELASATDSRLDSLEEGQVHTDARLDALIDAQIQLTHHVEALSGRFDALTESQIQLTHHVEALSGRFDKAGELLDHAAANIAQLAAAQQRTDEQIKSLLERNGSMRKTSAKKPKARKAAKTTPKKRGAK